MVLLCGVLLFATSRVIEGALAGFTLPDPDADLATAAALPPPPPLATADPREQQPTAQPGTGEPDLLATVAAAQTAAAASGIELPNVAATIAAVQTEVAVSLGGALGQSNQTPAGEDATLLSFGEAGSGQGFLDDPRGVAVGPDGAIYVADYSGGRVQRFSAEGRFERGWVMADDAPILALAADRAGRVFVSQASQISIFDGASGELRDTITDANGYGFEDLAITAEGELLGIPWAGDDLVRLSVEGAELGRITAPLRQADADSAPQALATDGRGTIYLLGEGGAAVFIFGADGAYRDRFAVDNAWAFSDMAVDGQGRIYVSGFPGSIHSFDGAGRPLGDLPAQGVAFDLSFDTANNLYLATNAPRVIKLAVQAVQ